MVTEWLPLHEQENEGKLLKPAKKEILIFPHN
jgi:hypothetical protein